MTDLLVIAASNGKNLLLAERCAAAGRAQGYSSEVLDLTAVALPLFTPRALAAGTPAALAGLQAQLSAAPHSSPISRMRACWSVSGPSTPPPGNLKSPAGPERSMRSRSP